MHIILGLLGTIVTILILLNRLSEAGIEIGWLNPFAWNRRRKWRNKYQGNPIFQLVDPLEVAALLCTSLAKTVQSYFYLKLNPSLRQISCLWIIDFAIESITSCWRLGKKSRRFLYIFWWPKYFYKAKLLFINESLFCEKFTATIPRIIITLLVNHASF